MGWHTGGRDALALLLTTVAPPVAPDAGGAAGATAAAGAGGVAAAGAAGAAVVGAAGAVAAGGVGTSVVSFLLGPLGVALLGRARAVAFAVIVLFLLPEAVAAVVLVMGACASAMKLALGLLPVMKVLATSAARIVVFSTLGTDCSRRCLSVAARA